MTTPALPGEAPDPSATPALHALLKEVDALSAKMRCRRMGDAICAAEDISGYAPILASMLRVAVDRIKGAMDSADQTASATGQTAWRVMAEWLDATLANIEWIAAGDQGDA